MREQPMSVAGSILVAAIGLACSGASGQDLLVSSRFSNNVLRFSGAGSVVGVFASGSGMANPNGIAFGPDKNLYVGLGDVGTVMRYHGRTGAFIDLFVSGGSGGLTGCRAIAFGPDGHLYVNAGAIDKVLRYDGQSGAFLGVAAEGNGMDGPVGLAFGPNGHLYIGAALSNAVYEFDAGGLFVRTFSAPGHNNATGVLFDGQGLMYVAQSVTNEVLRFDPASGQFLGVFAIGGGLSIPIGLTFRPDGSQLLVGSFGTDSVIAYDATLGTAIGPVVAPGSGGLDGTHNFAWFPCYPDCNDDAQLTVADFGCFQTKFVLPGLYADCNGDGARTVADFGCFQTAFAVGCP